MISPKTLIPGIARTLLPMPIRDRLRPLWQRLTAPTEAERRAAEIAALGPEKRWSAQQHEEIGGWDLVLDRKLWPGLRERQSDPNLPLQEYLTALIDAPLGSRVEVLDVGAGPLSFLGKKWEGRELHITAIDPNAEAYDRLLSKYGIDPPVRTRFGYAEDLSAFVPQAAFDLVHARNCIDHSKDALAAIREMVKAVKPGCYVFLNHVIREGRHEGYGGPHQWDLFPRRGRFYVQRPGMLPADVGAMLGDAAHVTVGASPESRTPDGVDWFAVKIRRLQQ